MKQELADELFAQVLRNINHTKPCGKTFLDHIILWIEYIFLYEDNHIFVVLKYTLNYSYISTSMI